ncbi:MAG: Fe-S cluster assembly protein SufD [Paramuribaculum sp.]|nr:Fe-S cluster assembly protein SufD [Paramuribaculum sp.]
MNALKDYIDLYRENRELLETQSPETLNAMRPKALEVLESKRLPEKGDPGYEHISIEDMFAPDRGVNINRVAIPADTSSAFRCGLPNVTPLLAYVINDTFVPTRELDRRLPEGLLFCSIKEAALKHPQILSRYYGTIAGLTDTTTALNTLLAQDGVMIYVPEGMTVDRPLQILNLFNALTPLLAVRRILIVVAPGAKVKIISCDHTLPEAGNILSSLVTEIYVAENATLDFCEMEETSARTSRCAGIYVSQHSDSDVNISSVTLLCGTTRNDFDIAVDGSGCRTRLSGMAIGSADSVTDNSSRVRHLKPRSESTQLFKYVLDDRSVGSFEGNILVTPQAPFTQAYQSNRNIIASQQAKMYTRPQLEIYNDDVKCSHGATTGQLDNEALFYMRTRGIPEHEARVMLMQAFMADVIESVRIDGLRERLRMLVENRFAGTTMACGDCHTACNKMEDGK